MSDGGALLVMSFIFLVLFFCFMAKRARCYQQQRAAVAGRTICGRSEAGFHHWQENPNVHRAM